MIKSLNLFHFLMRRMLPATPAELLQLQPVWRRLPVLGGRVIPLLALAALHRNDLSGHCSLLKSNAEVRMQKLLWFFTSAFLLLTSDFFPTE
jgi:hypothetical protein